MCVVVVVVSNVCSTTNNKTGHPHQIQRDKIEQEESNKGGDFITNYDLID